MWYQDENISHLWGISGGREYIHTHVPAVPGDSSSICLCTLIFLKSLFGSFTMRNVHSINQPTARSCHDCSRCVMGLWDPLQAINIGDCGLARRSVVNSLGQQHQTMHVFSTTAQLQFSPGEIIANAHYCVCADGGRHQWRHDSSRHTQCRSTKCPP